MKYQIGQTVITHAFETSTYTYYMPEMSQWHGKEGVIEDMRAETGSFRYVVHGWIWPESALSLPGEKSLPEEEPEPLLGVTGKYKAEPKPLDLTKILRVGDEIYSVLQGAVKVAYIERSSCCSLIGCTDNSINTVGYGFDGRCHDGGERLLFPSRTNRDWSTFKRQPDLKKGDIVRVWDNTNDLPVIRVFSHFAPLGDIRTYNYADGTQLWQHVEKISVDELKDFE